jgi:hypothetical protein
VATDIGKLFEKEFVKALRSLRDSHLLGWHRLTDTGAAGNVVAEQPSDYLLAVPPGAALPGSDQRMAFCEAKASEVNAKLTKAAMKPAQRGAIAHFRMLLTIPYLVVFYDATGGKLQIWDGAAVMKDRLDKAGLLAQYQDIGLGMHLNQVALRQALIDFFKLPDKQQILAASAISS